jgi:hypothetical protein
MENGLPSTDELMADVLSLGQQLELLLYKLRDAPKGSPWKAVRDHLDCAIGDVARAQARLMYRVR